MEDIPEQYVLPDQTDPPLALLDEEKRQEVLNFRDIFKVSVIIRQIICLQHDYNLYYSPEFFCINMDKKGIILLCYTPLFYNFIYFTYFIIDFIILSLPIFFKA